MKLSDAARARRHHEGRFAPPPIAVVSRSGDLPPRLFSDPEQPPILVTCARTAARLDHDDRLRVLIAGEDTVDVALAVAMLREQGMHRILCEGGPTLLDELVEADAVTELCVTLAPRLAASQPVELPRAPGAVDRAGHDAPGARAGLRRLPVSEVQPLTPVRRSARHAASGHPSYDENARLVASRAAHRKGSPAR